MGLLKIKEIMKPIATASILASPAAAQEPSKLFQELSGDTKIAKCAGKAFDAVRINGAKEYFNKGFNSLVQRQEEQFTNGSGALETIALGTIVDAGENEISLTAFHEGTKSDLEDAVKSVITLEFDKDGVTQRRGLISPDDPFTLSQEEALSSPHGAWTVSAAQTMEYAFTNCMDIMNPNRNPLAETSVGQPPAFFEP